jgi:GMP synthase (glutamine-hydrolysing)
MKIHWLQHVSFEGLGIIENWAQKSSHLLSLTRLYLNEPLPEPGTFDMLVIMGGPMSVNDEIEFPWLMGEKKFIEKCIRQSKPIIGICLGAQLIASVLGSRVYPNTFKEIGWYEINKTGQMRGHKLDEILPHPLTVMHWHGETFDIPARCLHLASSNACQNQAFIFGDRVLALQCHLESTKETVKSLVQNCTDEISKGGPYVQDEGRIIGDDMHYNEMNRCMDNILSYLAASINI